MSSVCTCGQFRIDTESVSIFVDPVTGGIFLKNLFDLSVGCSMGCWWGGYTLFTRITWWLCSEYTTYGNLYLVLNYCIQY